MRRALSGGLPAPLPFLVALRADRVPEHVRAFGARARTATQLEAARPRRVGEARPEPGRGRRGSPRESPRLVPLAEIEDAREVQPLRPPRRAAPLSPGQ